VLEQHDQFAAYGKGNVVRPPFKEDPFKGVDGNGQIRAEDGPFQGAVKLPEGIGVAEKPRENAVFVFTVCAHPESLFSE
jgi:hypothetical protein